MTEANAPFPDRIFTMLSSFHLAAALRTAIEIELFTAIAEGHTTADALAVRCKVNARGIRILADYLVINGFLTKRQNTYDLTAESRCYLVRHSPRYVGRQMEYRQSNFMLTQFDRLTQSVREGGAQLQGNAIEPDHNLWVTFASVMSDLMGPEAALVPPIIEKLLQQRRTSQPRKILDIAAGHGLFGIAFAKADPTCRVVAQDWPRVVEVARENALKQGISERFTTIAGGIMEVEIGDGYDVVLVPNLIHYLDRATSVQILKKARAAMNPGAIVAIVEFAPNEDRVSPPYAAFALLALAISPAGDAYTVSEILSMCTEAGFTNLSAWNLSMERLLVGTNPPHPDPKP